MKNREVFAKDPGTAELVNNGVAHVTDEQTADQLRTLRYELETFVCEGQYAKGLERILSTYLQNLGKPEQPAVWVSGFFGSGKSHLVKILRYLWVDFEFPDDHARARGLARLPKEVDELLTELCTTGKRHGGLHAAAGTLGAGAGDSVRLALLAIIFRSCGLPEDYPSARFVLWLKHEGILNAVQSRVESSKKAFRQELGHLYVSPVIAAAVRDSKPGFANTDAEARSFFKAQYPPCNDITNKQMQDAIVDALTVDGRFPCTLVVLDEVQQYIGENSDRTYRVQEVTETCSKHFGGSLMFVGTGQTALTGTPQLQKLKDRYRIPIELSDADVETVIRKIVLLKKPDKEPLVSSMLLSHSGEISRHLQGTKIEPRNEDQQYMAADYPLLPVRRRFWEKTLRAVDRAGTAGALRTQLKIVHEAVRAAADKPLGNVVPGDFVFDQISTDLVQTGVLLREIDEIIRRLRDGTTDGDFKSRICSLAFLIGKLPRDAGVDQGIRATPDAIADLLVQDLTASSADLRQRIPRLLEELKQAGHLMQVDDEFRLQTRESADWEREYGDRLLKLKNNEQKLASERADLLRTECGEQLKGIKLPQGKSKVSRKIDVHFGGERPEIGHSIPVWVHDGWNVDDKSMLADCRKEDTDSPLIFVYVPRRSAEDFKNAIASHKAAEETLQVRGLPTSNEGLEARKAMETRLASALVKRNAIVGEVLSGARVYLAGGSEKTGIVLKTAVEDAAKDALLRMFPQFDLADDPRWSQVIERVKKGAADALEVLGYTGDVEKHPVCSQVYSYIAAGRKGREIRKHFEAIPYGWPQDAIDGALLLLVNTGHVSAKQDGQPLQFKQLEQTKIGIADFRAESATVTTVQRISIRKLFQAAGINCKPNEEAIAAGQFIAELIVRAKAAGGDPPQPEPPAITQLEDLSHLSGNEQLLALHEQRDALTKQAVLWQQRRELIQQRLPRWEILKRLCGFAATLPVAEEVRSQVDAVRESRLLIVDPDPVPALCDILNQALREELVKLHSEYSVAYDEQLAVLAKANPWQTITEGQRASILTGHSLTQKPTIAVGTEKELLDTLERGSLADWRTRRDALAQRFSDALIEAARLLEPKSSRVKLPVATLTSEAEVDDWLAKSRKVIISQLQDGPVII